MKANLIKYQHYFILLFTLLIANYVVVPLASLQSEQIQTLRLIEKQFLKTQQLISSQSEFESNQNQLLANADILSQFVFTDETESTFKLTAQSAIEKTLQKAECTVEHIAFKGNTLLDNNIQRWTVEMRFRGEALCLIQTTHMFDIMTPHINIEGFNFNHRGLSEEPTGEFNAVMNILLWYSASANKEGIYLNNIKDAQ